MIDNVPTHLAIVPDGNRRWSKLHGVPAFQGHRAGAETMHRVVDSLITYQVKYLTVWGFSADNWKRTQDEVSSLFRLLARWIEIDAPWLNSRGVGLRCSGRIGELPQYLQLAIREAAGLTSENNRMILNLAFNYSGRTEILDAVRRLLKEGVTLEKLDEQLFSRYLYTNNMPDVDLLIRTANELRLSNFMLWQAAYSEYYFTPVLWPDFNEDELEKALQDYSERKRRFGGD